MSGMVNLDDFQVSPLDTTCLPPLKIREQEVAMKILSPTALAYYCSGADDELSE